MKKRKKRKHHAPTTRKRNTAGGKQPVSPLKMKLEEINRLKPIVQQAKGIAQRERVRQSIKNFEEERRI